jgi:hypothetical protein
VSEVKNALLLVGSPKGERSTSASLGAYLMNRLAERGMDTSRVYLARRGPGEGGIAEAVYGADLVVLAFPLYVDSQPALVARAMEEIYARRDLAPKGGLLAIVNCGFPEALQADTALAICRQFAGACGLEWLGGLALGMGAAIGPRPLEKTGGMGRLVRKALDMTAQAMVEEGEVPREAGLLMRRPMMSPAVYTWMGNRGWNAAARRRGTLERMRDRPYAR